jgi:Zn-dependent metalloprotease
MLDWLFGKK